MATLGQWQGAWQGDWFGPTEEAPPGSMSGSASISITATGTLTTDAVVEAKPDNNHPGRWKYVYNKNQFVRKVGKDLVVYEYIEPDEPQTAEEKKVTVIKKGKPAIPVAFVPVAQIKAEVRQYPAQQQRIMRMFEQAQFEQILIAYEKMQQEEEEDMEMVLYTL